MNSKLKMFVSVLFCLVILGGVVYFIISALQTKDKNKPHIILILGDDIVSAKVSSTLTKIKITASRS